MVNVLVAGSIIKWMNTRFQLNTNSQTFNSYRELTHLQTITYADICSALLSITEASPVFSLVSKAITLIKCKYVLWTVLLKMHIMFMTVYHDRPHRNQWNFTIYHHDIKIFTILVIILCRSWYIVILWLYSTQMNIKLKKQYGLPICWFKELYYFNVKVHFKQRL